MLFLRNNNAISRYPLRNLRSNIVSLVDAICPGPESMRPGPEAQREVQNARQHIAWLATSTRLLA